MVNRETVRDDLAALFTTALVGSGLPLQELYGYPRGDFSGKTAVMTMASMGSYRGKVGKFVTGAGMGSEFLFHLYSWVLYSDEGSWNEDDAEDCVDEIEKIVADVVEANRSGANAWGFLEYDGRSQRESWVISNALYICETIPLKVTVYG